jgi:hypothetical protein
MPQQLFQEFYPMNRIYQNIRLGFVLFMLTIGSVQIALAQGNSANAPGNSGGGSGNSANAPGKNMNLGHGNASNGVKAIIQTNRQIFYTGDLLDIGIRFPRGADLIQSGEVDAWLMIFEPDATLSAIPISSEASPKKRNLFRIDEMDTQFLPEGVYQLGVVITVAGGDPMNLLDWYNGMLGMLTVRGLTVSSEALDIDENGDGFVDGDTSGDGFVDDDDDDEDEDEDDDDGEA